MGGLRGRLRRTAQKVEKDSVVIHLKDGGRRIFTDQECFTDVFLAKMELFRGGTRDSEVLDAVRNATPESREAFEREYGPITMEARIIAPDWVEVYSLSESGEVEKVRHEGEDAERMRQEARQSHAGGGKLA